MRLPTGKKSDISSAFKAVTQTSGPLVSQSAEAAPEAAPANSEHSRLEPMQIINLRRCESLHYQLSYEQM
jgi:hypothetical protein